MRRLLAPRSIAVVGRRPPTGHDRPRGVPQPARRRVHRRRLPGEPARHGGRERPGVPDASSTSPTRSTSRSSPCRPRRCADVVRGVRGEGRARAHRHQRRVRRARQRRGRAGARRAGPPHGMRLVGPNGMGVVNTDPDVSMNATFAPFRPVRGRRSASRRSPARSASSCSARPRSLGLGVSTFVSMGNKADVSSNDLLQYWDHDPGHHGDPPLPRVVREPAEVRAARPSGRSQQADPRGEERAEPRGHARRRIAHRRARVVGRRHRRAVPPGRRRARRHARRAARRRAGARAPAAAAGPAGRDRLERRRSGHPRVRRVRGRRARGAGALRRDPGRRSRSFVSPDASTANPSTSSLSATAATYERAIRTVLADPDIDAVIVIFVPPLVTDSDDVARAIVAAASDAGREADRRVLPDPGQRARDPAGAAPTTAGRSRASRSPRPRRSRSSRAAATPSGADGPRAGCRTSPGSTGPARPRPRRRRARASRGRVARARGRGRPVPRPSGSRSRRCGTPTRPTRPRSAAEELGFPVAFKAGRRRDRAQDRRRRRRARPGGRGRGPRGVRRDAAGARGAARWRRRAADGRAPGIETIVGVTQDPSFGPLVLFGMGGVGAELVRDTALRLVPLTDLDAADLVRSLRSSPLLFGYRGAPADRRRRARGPAAARRHARRRDPRGARARLQPRRRPPRRRRRDRHEDPPRPHARRTRPPRSAASAPPRPRPHPLVLASLTHICGG